MPAFLLVNDERGAFGAAGLKEHQRPKRSITAQI